MGHSLRGEVCFAGPEGPLTPPQVASLFSRLQQALLDRHAIKTALNADDMELVIQSVPPMRLIAWDAPTHCALRLFDEPIDEERLNGGATARSVLGALHEPLTSDGYEQEWIGENDDDIGEVPFDT